MADNSGLTNQAILTKIDRLRELNVGAIIPLPQLVVVGDQSSGKSSVLESLTGFSFPRATGLCTRYATQITCSRETRRSIVISIIPRPGADAALKKKLGSFQKHVTDFNNDVLAQVFEDANDAMGIRMVSSSEDVNSLGAFSQDILKIEIGGPEETHLTVIDVPGIFRVPTHGLTTESDVGMVQNMVKSYMKDSRTIILAVMPCNVDIATQEILKLAEAADPSGDRTMGVLTKPDLAQETATQNAVIDLVCGRRNVLNLGYHVVKNRSADDNISTALARMAEEKDFFSRPPWSSVTDRCGTESLKARLRELLMHVTKSELPHVRTDIDTRLRESRNALEMMGPARTDEFAHRRYLGRLATKFQDITQCALNGYYAGHDTFDNPQFRLITQIVTLNHTFSDVFLKKGHKRAFAAEVVKWKKDEGVEKEDETFGEPTSDWALPPQKTVRSKKSAFKGSELVEPIPEPYEDDGFQFSIPKAEPPPVQVETVPKSQVVSIHATSSIYPELADIICATDYECPPPLHGSIMDHIKFVFESSRGPELGTFNGTVLATLFKDQSEKWEDLALSHTSMAITLVHDYIYQLLTLLCPEKQVLDQLWDSLLVDKLHDAYRQAMNHARFLLSIERGGKPITYNHYFNATLQKKRFDRTILALEVLAITDAHGERVIPVKKLTHHSVNENNAQQIREDLRDTLESYYKVSRKRFVDAICQQAISHFLLDTDSGPLKILSPDLIMSLDASQLEMIAGEDPQSKIKRQGLQREVKSLEEAVKLLRN